MKLSIIIPVYNVEKYISICLDSVVNQVNVSYNDYEVIIVNDGSPDHSIDIINNYNWRGCNHMVISQTNKGLSGARNKGLDYANGEYIWFIDSDDYIKGNAISKIICHADGADLINIGYQEERNGIKGKTCNPSQYSEGVLHLLYGYSQPAQFHIYKKSFLVQNNIRFMDGIYHEDAEFTPRCLYLSKTIRNICEPLYIYQLRNGSIMTTLNPKRAFDNLIVANSLLCFSERHSIPMNTNPILGTICLCINNALFIISKASKNDQKKWIKVFDSNPMFTTALMSSKTLKYKLEGYLFKMLPVNGIIIYNFLTKLK